MLLTTIELFVVFISSVILAFYVYYRHCFNYWKKKGVPQLNPSFPVGDLGSSALGTESIYVRLQTLYHEFKNAGCKFGGIYFFNGPIYYPIHPELIKRVLQTDFDHFIDRGMYINPEKVYLSSNIFTQTGEEWKSIRTKLTPAFSSGKLKSMYSTILDVSQNFRNILEPFAVQEAEVEMKEYCMRYTSDIIGSVSFGVECNSLKYPDTEFTRALSALFFNPPWKLFLVMLKEGLQNPGNINKIFMDKKILDKYFTNLVQETMEYRDKNNIVRNDILNSLMQMRSSGFTLQEIVSQAFLFFTAGFETSSTVISYCLHELAYEEEMQEKLREEIHKNLGRDSSKYTNEELSRLPYLDKCIKETMRKYPVVAILNRICVKDYKIPDTDVVIEKNTPVIIPVLGLHRDPDFFPDPLKFDPERFNNENHVTPFSYLPFGEGPRNCIGLRLGLMQTKLGLATLLNDFKFLPSDLTPRHLEVETSTTSLVFTVRGGIHKKIVKI